MRTINTHTLIEKTSRAKTSKLKNLLKFYQNKQFQNIQCHIFLTEKTIYAHFTNSTKLLVAHRLAQTTAYAHPCNKCIAISIPLLKGTRKKKQNRSRIICQIETKND